VTLILLSAISPTIVFVSRRIVLSDWVQFLVLVLVNWQPKKFIYLAGLALASDTSILENNIA
jgi:hypothetical protein